MGIWSTRRNWPQVTEINRDGTPLACGGGICLSDIGQYWRRPKESRRRGNLAQVVPFMLAFSSGRPGCQMPRRNLPVIRCVLIVPIDVALVG